MGIFDFITGSSPTETEQEFLLFPQLPAELRLKIWRHALPERVIEASLRFEGKSAPSSQVQLLTATDGTWSCAHSAKPDHASKTRPDPRCLPALFRVNLESRDLCLREYVKLSRSYIHPRLDFLYISWYWNPIITSNDIGTKFYPITGQPLAGFKNIAITIGRNPSFNTRFGALADCLQKLGVPKKLLLSLVGPKLPSVQSISTGYSISSGNTVVILDWPRNPDLNMAQSVRAQVISAIEDKQQRSTFKIPDIDQRLYYIYSGP